MLSDVLSSSRLSSSIRSPMNYNRRSPEEFQWKIFLGDDLQPLAVLVVLAVLCHLHWEVVRHSPMVNIVSQTMNQHNSLPIRLKGNSKRTSGNSLSLLEVQNKDPCAASQTVLIRV